MQAKSMRLRADVALVPLSESCARRMLGWMQDPEIVEAIGLTKEPSMQRTIEFIEKANRGIGIWAWAIVRDSEHVGNLIFDQLDETASTIRLSVYIGERSARGQGIGKTAIHQGLTR